MELSIQSCLPCQVVTLKNCREPLKMTELPSGPWEHIAVDFKWALTSGGYLLVVIDEYSRFAKIDITKSTSIKSRHVTTGKGGGLPYSFLKIKKSALNF